MPKWRVRPVQPSAEEEIALYPPFRCTPMYKSYQSMYLSPTTGIGKSAGHPWERFLNRKKKVHAPKHSQTYPQSSVPHDKNLFDVTFQSINQSINRCNTIKSMKHLINQSINQSLQYNQIYETFDQSINRSSDWVIKPIDWIDPLHTWSVQNLLSMHAKLWRERLKP